MLPRKSTGYRVRSYSYIETQLDTPILVDHRGATFNGKDSGISIKLLVLMVIGNNVVGFLSQHVQYGGHLLNSRYDLEIARVTCTCTFRISDSYKYASTIYIHHRSDRDRSEAMDPPNN